MSFPDPACFSERSNLLKDSTDRGESKTTRLPRISLNIAYSLCFSYSVQLGLIELTFNSFYCPIILSLKASVIVTSRIVCN
jgi:hypothetical protein